MSEASAAAKNGKTTAQAPTGAGTAVMYLGPNAPYGLPITYNAVFIAGRPPAVCDEAMKKYPHFAACFVPVAILGKSLAALRDKNSTLAQAAGKVARETLALKTAKAAGKGGK